MHKRSLFSSWIRSTMYGWCLGIPTIILFTVLTESLGLHSLQTPVGAGMGLSIGFFQSRAIRSCVKPSSAWFWSSLLGLTAPFLAVDVVRTVGVNLPYSLYGAVIVSAVILGAWQAALLLLSFRRGASWIVASVFGWTLASGAVAGADFLGQTMVIAGTPGALVYLGVVTCGGVLLALTTGLALVRLLPSEPSA